MRDLPASKYRKGGGDRFYPVTLYMILGLRDKKYQDRICQVVWAFLLCATCGVMERRLHACEL